MQETWEVCKTSREDIKIYRSGNRKLRTCVNFLRQMGSNQNLIRRTLQANPNKKTRICLITQIKIKISAESTILHRFIKRNRSKIMVYPSRSTLIIARLILVLIFRVMWVLIIILTIIVIWICKQINPLFDNNIFALLTF